MANISVYWGNKEERAKIALQHTLEMSTKYADKIKLSRKNSVIYSPNSVFMEQKVKNQNMSFSLVSEGSVSAIIKFAEGKTAVLNFASYKHPGGGFLAGSKAQEECLCHESFLYNVLREFPFYYKQNSTNLNRALYTNRAIYSPNVIFESDDKVVECDVITCAAPNITAATKYNKNISQEENLSVLRSRIKFVLDIAAENKVDTLILGAFGCGVFGQDAAVVCNIFLEYLTNDYRCFNKIVFAVPADIHQENLTKFLTVLTEWEKNKND